MDAEENPASRCGGDEGRQQLGVVSHVVGQIGRIDRVRIAAAVQHWVLVVHISEGERLHVDMEIVEGRVEGGDLDRVGLAGGIVGGDIVVGKRAGCSGNIHRRGHVQVTEHPHLHVLGRLHVAMEEEGSGLYHFVVVGEGAPHVDSRGGHRLPVENGGCLGKAVPVDRMGVEQVGTHHHPDIGKREIDVVALPESQGGCREGHAEHGAPHHVPHIPDGRVSRNKGGKPVYRSGPGHIFETEDVLGMAIRFQRFVGHVDEAVAGSKMEADLGQAHRTGDLTLVGPNKTIAVEIPEYRSSRESRALGSEFRSGRQSGKEKQRQEGTN